MSEYDTSNVKTFDTPNEAVSYVSQQYRSNVGNSEVDVERFKNAWEIWNVGASNPRAVARELVKAIDEACSESGSRGAKDAAVIMILDQLCYLCGTIQPSLAMHPVDWGDIKAKVKESVGE